MGPVSRVRGSEQLEMVGWRRHASQFESQADASKSRGPRLVGGRYCGMCGQGGTVLPPWGSFPAASILAHGAPARGTRFNPQTSWDGPQQRRCHSLHPAR